MMEPGPGVPKAGNIEQRARQGPAWMPGTETEMAYRASHSAQNWRTDRCPGVKLDRGA